MMPLARLRPIYSFNRAEFHVGHFPGRSLLPFHFFVLNVRFALASDHFRSQLRHAGPATSRACRVEPATA